MEIVSPQRKYEVMPSRSRKNISYDRNDDAFPDLNASSLESLTKKIQDNLKGSNNAPPKPQALKPKKKHHSGNLHSDGSLSIEDVQSKSAANDTLNTKLLQSKSTTPSKPEQTQGNKRLRNGQVKDYETDGSVKNPTANSTQLGSKPLKPSTDRDDLEDEILALGGVKDDLELLKDVASESEFEGDTGVTAKSHVAGFKDELSRMVQELGIEKVGNRVLDDDVYTDDDEDKEIAGYQKHKQEEGRMEKTNANTTAGGVRAHERLDGVSIQPVTETPKSKVRSKTQLLFQPQSEWHSVELPPVPQSKIESRAMPLDLSLRLHEHAKVLLENENTEYAIHHGAASTEYRFYSTLMSAGTLSDKISALTLSVQESPLHNMKALESLLGLARKRSRDQAVNVLGALKDLFGPGNLLPSDRRLRNFANQPVLAAAFRSSTLHSWTSSSPLPKPLNKTHLILFAYEDWLKSIYFEMLQILENWCNDEVAYARGKAVDYIASLLRDKPEQEANLLRLIVNKLGDSDKKIASKSSFNILQLETTHPLMKRTIIAAIESDILFRPNQSLHAQYYAAITLNQTVLSVKEDATARRLLDIYFGLFAKLLKRPEADAQEVKGPSSGIKDIIVNRKGEIQGGGGPAGKKALKRQKSAEKSTAVKEDLQEKMLSAILTGINRAIPYTAVKDDFFEKYMDQLYRITHSANFNTSIQALILIQQMNGVNQASQDRFYRVLYESLLDSRLLTSSKQALYLNLLFRALRSDLNLNRVRAFVKRLLQVITMQQPPFVCGVLYLLRELEKTFPALAMLIDEPEEIASDDEEAFHDVDNAKEASPNAFNAVSRSSTKSSRYDARKRDPVHSDASTTCVWELSSLLLHYHPSVSLFATRLLCHDSMPPKPDLQQNTLISFLDRFVYKNPKTGGNAKPKGASLMQPLGSSDDGNVLLSAFSGVASRAQPVNSDTFWRQQGADIGADEVFFHKYFSAVKSKEEKKREKKAKKNMKGEDNADSSDDDEEEEAEIWKALVDSRPEIEGDDSDVDMGFSDDEELAAAMHEDDDDLTDLDDDSHSRDDNNEAISDVGNDLLEGVSASYDKAPSNLAKTLERSWDPRDAAVSDQEVRGDRQAKRRKVKGLPTFASADDYAKMLADGSDDDD